MSNKTNLANIWFPQYINEFIADTFDYSAEEIGVLQILKVHYWKRADSGGGHLPDLSDVDLAAITRLPIDRVEVAKNLLKKLYTFDGKKWQNFVEDEAIKKAYKKKKDRSKAGKSGARVRYSKEIPPSKTDGKSLANDIAKDVANPIAKTWQSQSQSQSQSESNSYSQESLSYSPTETEEYVDKSSSSSSKEKYAFEGRVIKLTHKDFKSFEKNYRHIPDLRGELASLDVFYAEEKPIPKKWFMRMCQALNNKNQKYAETKKSQQIEQEKPKKSRQPEDVAKEWGYA
jgi:uncharacterized protein YdaU (DUF1376 family)